MDEVRRGDGELCGFVRRDGGRWSALTVFGAILAQHDSEVDARRHVVEHGLAVLADRWTLFDTQSGTEQVVCIQQASPAEVSLALGYYTVPGVESVNIPTGEIASGRWRLEPRG